MTTPPEAEAIPDDVRAIAEKIATDHCAVIDYEGELAEDIARAIMQDRRTRNAPDSDGTAEPVAVETSKLYHSRWPTEDLLKAREPGGLITDDGEAWKYQYTHSDAQGGAYDLVYRPRAMIAATPPAPAASPASGGEVTVKPLEWYAWPGDGSRQSEGQGRKRDYVERAAGTLGAVFLMVKDGSYSLSGAIEAADDEFQSADDAKAAAQANYEQQIRSALIASPEQGEVVRELVELCQCALSLIETMFVNDPNEPISDVGHVALDAWKNEVERIKDALVKIGDVK